MKKRSVNKAVLAQRRRGRLMPAGVPRWIRVYDNGGKTCDRYTCCFTGRYRKRVPGQSGWHDYVSMSANPYHPQGFGQHGQTEHRSADVRHIPGKQLRWPPALGRKCHLGTRIKFTELPKDCQKLVLLDYKELWGLK